MLKKLLLLSFALIFILATVLMAGLGEKQKATQIPGTPGNLAAPLDICQYYKPAYLDYAPAGMPDFDQKQNGWFTGIPPGQHWTYCGPVALANCLWWFDSKFETCATPPPTICNHYHLVDPYGAWDDHAASNVIPFVDSMALYCGTNANGTNVFNLATGAQNWITKAGLANLYTVQVMPLDPAFGFEFIRQEVLRSQDVILLLGFWQEVVPGYCERIGGHFVTVAGVCTDPVDSALCISDPYYDHNEGEPPAGSAHGSGVHNDAQFVSGPHGTMNHDRYDVVHTTCAPSGPYPYQMEFANYPITPQDALVFYGLNLVNPTPPVTPTGAPIHTILEFAVIICPVPDSDGDGIPDPQDNCPNNYNPGQEDSDQDGKGDVCDNCPHNYNPGQEDADLDGVGDVCDNCPGIYNPNQADADADGKGDVCDNCPNNYNPGQEDTDQDGIGNVCDNCPNNYNPNQADADADGLGDVCDNCPNNYNPGQEDGDQDGVGDICDNCPTKPNANQADFDGDGIGDVCDNCPKVANHDQADRDHDGAGDLCDNCPDLFNPGQEDADQDGVGNACDPDFPTYFKPGYPDYAPFGMPDIDQKQMPWWNGAQWTYCGPVAVANCLFWFDSKYQFLINPLSPPPPAINDNFRLIVGTPMYDDHDVQNVQPFVNQLAAGMGTGMAGTDITNMLGYIRTYLVSLGLDDSLEATLWPKPTWELVRDEVKRSQDVILLLGFWQEDPSSPIGWSRIGGHYVTAAGVDTVVGVINPQIYISDPYFDMLEGDPPVPPHPANVHNDLALISGPHGTNYHDAYPTLVPSPSPGGIILLPNYPINMNPNYPMQFYGQNCPSEFANYQRPWMQGPIFTEVEYALTICPFVCDCVPGDANNSGNFNALDVTYLINFLYKHGPAPKPYALCSGDPNCSCVINALDVTYLINFLYKHGLAPCDCRKWVTNCGMPLRQ